MPERRFAIYFAPAPTSPLWRFATSWLGRDALTGKNVDLVQFDACPANSREELIASPRHYGFHATLKPPFHLAAERSEEELVGAVANLASQQSTFLLPGLRISELSHFLALTLAGPCPPLSNLADRCVSNLDEFRRPASPRDLEKRQHAGMPPRQVELLRRWGYPYVFDQWKFHMTLTSSLADEQLRSVARQFLETTLPPILSEPLPCDSVCIFIQEHTGAPFLLRHRFHFPG